MKFVLSTLLILVLAGITYGYYLKESGDFNGEILIGICVLVIAFIIMPLFIFHRYKDKDLSSFHIDNFNKRNKDEDKDDSNSNSVSE